MKYTDLVKEIASQYEDITQADVRAVFNSLNEIAVRVLSEGDTLSIDGLVKLSMVEQKGRTGVIQLGAKKGETFQSPNKMVAKCKLFPRFQEAVSYEVE